MSDKLVGEAGEKDVNVPGYEPPAVTVVGNARALLAGGLGSITDADQSDPDFPNQASH